MVVVPDAVYPTVTVVAVPVDLVAIEWKGCAKKDARAAKEPTTPEISSIIVVGLVLVLPVVFAKVKLAMTLPFPTVASFCRA